jgi:hypothetical protein
MRSPDQIVNRMAVLKAIRCNAPIARAELANTDWNWAGTSALALEQTYLSDDRLGKTPAGEDVLVES